MSFQDSIKIMKGDCLTNLLTCYNTLFNGMCKALSSPFLVTIVSCTIEEAVSYAECSFNSLIEI